MDMSVHRFAELFAQLGLPSDEPAIRRFIATHSPLAAGHCIWPMPLSGPQAKPRSCGKKSFAMPTGRKWSINSTRRFAHRIPRQSESLATAFRPVVWRRHCLPWGVNAGGLAQKQ